MLETFFIPSQTERSERRSNEAGGPIVMVNSSNDVFREPIIPKVENGMTPKTKTGMNAFSVGICLAKSRTM